MKYPVLMFAAVALLAAAPAPPAPTPPPTPPPLTDTQASPAASPDAGTPATTASPAPSPTSALDSIFGNPGGGRGKHAATGATPSPPPDTRKGLDGVWEVQIQRGPKTEYEHMNLIQTGQNITGTFLTKDNKKYPVTGSLDGQSNVRLVVSLSDGTTMLFEARLDGTTDMLGMYTNPQERVPFTAAYRPKEKWIDNVNASPGGLGGGSGPP
ncbi:MAG: hypothetical protein ABR949_03260 [Candidatus Aquilonibacter sp.]